MKKIALLLALSIATFTLTACPSQKPAHHDVKKVFVLGDPMSLIAGATKQPDVDLSFFENTSEVHVLGIESYVSERTYKMTKKKRDIKDENKPRTNTDYGKSFPFKVSLDNSIVRLSSGSAKITIFPPVGAASPSVILSEQNGKTSEEIIAEVLHFSRSKGENLASLLIRHKDNKSRSSLMAIYIARKWTVQKPEKTKEPYNYFLGPAMKVGWAPGNIQLDICGDRIHKFTPYIEGAANKWNGPLKEKVKLKVNNAKTFYPFSDLNQHCIYLVDSYLVEPSEKKRNLGMTRLIFDLNHPKIIDSDIFLFAKEFKKNGYDISEHQNLFSLFVAILHELGHFIGLHHQFDGTPSIMSYDMNTRELTKYDREAAQALYE